MQYPVHMSSTDGFDRWFRDRLKARTWSQSDFARSAGVPKSTVSAWYRGVRLPDPPMCDVIADVFGLPVDDVLTIAGHRPATEPIKPDDPRTEFIGLVKRVKWTPERVAMMRSILTGMAEYDRRERSG